MDRLGERHRQGRRHAHGHVDTQGAVLFTCAGRNGVDAVWSNAVWWDGMGWDGTTPEMSQPPSRSCVYLAYGKPNSRIDARSSCIILGGAQARFKAKKKHSSFFLFSFPHHPGVIEPRAPGPSSLFFFLLPVMLTFVHTISCIPYDTRIPIVHLFSLFFVFVFPSQVGYPVLTLHDDGSTSQARFLAMAADADADADGNGSREGGTVWPIPARVVWEDAGEEEELVVMLNGAAGGGGDDDDRRLTEKMQGLQAAGKWFKVRLC